MATITSRSTYSTVVRGVGAGAPRRPKFNLEKPFKLRITWPYTYSTCAPPSTHITSTLGMYNLRDRRPLHARAPQNADTAISVFAQCAVGFLALSDIVAFRVASRSCRIVVADGSRNVSFPMVIPPGHGFVKRCAAALAACPNAPVVAIANRRGGADATATQIARLAAFKGLRTLRVTVACGLRDLLGTLAALSQSLESLQISCRSTTRASPLHAEAALGLFPRLRILDVNIGDFSGTVSLIRSAPGLVSLAISCPSDTAPPFVVLATALPCLSHLVKLLLRNTVLTDDSVAVLASVLPHLAALSDLDISSDVVGENLVHIQGEFIPYDIRQDVRTLSNSSFRSCCHRAGVCRPYRSMVAASALAGLQFSGPISAVFPTSNRLISGARVILGLGQTQTRLLRDSDT